MGSPECAPCHSTLGSVFPARVAETMFPNIAGSRFSKSARRIRGASLLRRTSRYDAQTSAFGISNDFRCISYVIPFWVVSSAMNVIPIPSLQTHYRSFITTTNESAPVARYVPETGSHVP
ncbi:hypothetical protein [Escherichia coli]|uniref:hypothetical protein n=1 Tax=Escherichia coli TaxID=562 RepID=UPI001FCA4D1A|nr:hypothetical protein [Escherichia coli]